MIVVPLAVVVLTLWLVAASWRWAFDVVVCVAAALSRLLADVFDPW